MNLRPPPGPPDPRDEETLFAQALALPEAERPAFLARACGDDPALRSSIEALLRAHLAATSFLPSAVGVAHPPARSAALAEEQPGDWIDRYRLLQKIGEGGCGIVYMAEQEEPVRRRVALKVIKLGMDTKAVVARFDAERQALALMEHPNIAKVLDAGATGSGRPYFVMELVRGTPVTKYCDDSGLATEGRLELFTQICHAIQHAHQKGIIHRDIKPSNILVTLHDGVPVPKVIDFGIAKATQGRLTDHTLFTAFDQFIGTPAYMSPEQAELSGLDIDTRSDVYSLGVLLYELLAGRPPFDPKSFVSVGLDEMRRMIREVDPPRPSTRLSTLTETDRSTVAKQHGTAPAQLSLVLTGDLDWIVMRCLEKDRTRRYATPSELVADLQRHRRNEPVTARPPSTGYLLRKLVRRHKLGFAAGTAIAVSLIAGLVLSSLLLVRERAARERAVAAEATESRLRHEAELAGARETALRAEAEASASQARIAAARSTQVAGFMTDMLKGVGPNVALGRDTELLRDILDTTARRLDTELRDQPAVSADLHATLGDVYIDLGQSAVAEPMLRAAVATHRQVYGPQSAEAAASLHVWGKALRMLNRTAEAKTALSEALAIRRQLFGGEHPLVADTLCELAWVLSSRDDNSAMQAMVEQALAIRRKAFGPEHPAVAAALFQLGRAAQIEIDHIKAAPLHEEALAMRRRLLGNDHPEVADSLFYLGFSYAHELDKQSEAAAAYGESLALRRRVLGDAHPDTVVSLMCFVGPRAARDIPPATVQLVREFVANQRKLLPPTSPLLGSSLLALAMLVNTPDRNPAEAEALIREARLILERARADGTPLYANLITTMSYVAWFKFVANVPAEGVIMGEEAVKLARTAFGPDGSGTFMPTHILAWVYLGLGRHEDAAQQFEAAVALLSLNPRFENSPLRLVDVAALGAAYCASNRVARAHEFLATTLAPLDAKYGRAGPAVHVPLVQGELGLTLLREGRYAEAEALLRRTVAEYDQPRLKIVGRRLCPLGRLTSGLGQALAAQGKFAEAEPLVVGAFQELKATEHRIAGNRAGLVRDAHAAVIALYIAWGKPGQAAEWNARLNASSAGSP